MSTPIKHLAEKIGAAEPFKSSSKKAFRFIAAGDLPVKPTDW